MGSFKKIHLKIGIALLFMVSSVGIKAGYDDGLPQALGSKIFSVCGHKVKLEIADTQNKRMIGLMNRTGIEKGKGMLFVFPKEEMRTFWMRNVSFDIDIGFFDSKGKLVKSMTMAGTSPMETDDALPKYPSEAPAQFAVEVPKGFYKGNLKKCRLTPLLKAAE